MTVIQYKIRRFATIQSDLGHIWEQEAASSSLATPIKEKATMQNAVKCVCTVAFLFPFLALFFFCLQTVP